LLPRRLGDPRRMLEHRAKQLDEGGTVHAVERAERDAHDAALRYGKFLRQCRAMSTRRQIQTLSCFCTWSRNRASACARPGRPTKRQWRPTDIMRGRVSPSW